jgi:glycerol-3-phosphate O-acyltransferase/dihydroxyacetone phosphate acyltransferase
MIKTPPFWRLVWYSLLGVLTDICHQSVPVFRRLYNSDSSQYPIHQKTVLHKRILRRLSSSRQDISVQNLLHRLNDYHLKLQSLGLQHHQVKYAVLSRDHALLILLLQLSKLIIASLATAPGLMLFSPIMLLAHSVSKSKARGAVAASPFRLEGRDVLSSWKVLVALTFAPLIYTFYVASLTYWAYQNRRFGVLPHSVPVQMVPLLGFILLPAITLLSLYPGDYTIDIFKTLRPLILRLRSNTASQMHDLLQEQWELSAAVRKFVDFPDFKDQDQDQDQDQIMRQQLLSDFQNEGFAA